MKVFSLLSLLIVCLMTTQIFAATFTVTTTAATGTGSLRQAILDANALPGADTINFDITDAGPHTIQLAAALPAITGNVDLLNTSGESISVRGQGTGGSGGFRIFTINSGVTANIFSLTITNGGSTGHGGGIENQGTLTITNSIVSNNGALANGGGIFNQGTLTLTNSIVRDNDSGASGGGIFNSTDASTLTVTNSIVTDNATGGGGGGGGIANQGTPTLTNSTIDKNTATFGGGIYNTIYLNIRSSLTLVNSTVSNNTAVNGGGGILNELCNASITNSTFNNNAAGTSFGGGIYHVGDTRSPTTNTLTLTNSTISINIANNGGGLFNQQGTVFVTNSTISNNTASQSGGNIYSIGNIDERKVTLRSSIVANGLSIGTGPDLYGDFISEGYNLLENTSGAFSISQTANSGTNITGQDPNLGALANNGGPTQTRELLAGSPAIDKGFSFGLTTDQRGLTRPIDNPSIANATSGDSSDIGAFEVQLVPTAATVSIIGRVTTASGKGIRNVMITIIDSQGYQRTAQTSAFGHYRFDGVAAGETITLTARAKQFRFNQSSIVRTTNQSITDADFVSEK